jgi:hypothetical protein
MDDVCQLIGVLRFDRVTVAASGQPGTVLCTDDEYALVRLDSGDELTVPLDQIRLVAH